MIKIRNRNYQKNRRKSSNTLVILPIMFVFIILLSYNKNTDTLYSNTTETKPINTINYQYPYIFEITWNLNDIEFKSYSNSLNTYRFDFDDGSNIEIFYKKDFKKQLKNNEILLNLELLLDNLKNKYINSETPLNKPILNNIVYIGDKDINLLADEYYKKNNIPYFSAVFSSLEENSKKAYIDKIINNQEIDILKPIIKFMDKNLVDYCAEKVYNINNVVYFANLVPYMSDDTKQYYAQKSYNDNKTIFLDAINDFR